MKNRKMLIILVIIIFIMNFSFVIGTNSSKVSNDIEKSNTSGAIAMYIEGEDGEYNQSDENTFPKEGYVLNAEKSSCKNGGSLTQNENTKEVSLNIGDVESCTLYFDKEVLTGIDSIIASSKGTRTSFDEPATTDEGIFEMEDDYGKSYYYRGAVENNYVKFAGFYWRIIRINGDGSLRIMYDGTQGYANGTSNTGRFIKTGQTYNTNFPDAKYVGWMYGPTGTTASTSKTQAQTNTADSTIKGVVDAWYKTNIADKGYGSAVSDTLFCNDRSTPGKTTTLWTNDTGLGYGRQLTAYGAYARMRLGFSGYTGTVPTFKCPQKNDAFTVKDTSKGNGALTYPVGLITADEIVAAGSGKYNTSNSKYYLYNPSAWYWSLSPRFFDGAYSTVFGVNAYGQLNDDRMLNGGAVTPVINLSAEYVKTMNGTGTMTDPYQAV